MDLFHPKIKSKNTEIVYGFEPKMRIFIHLIFLWILIMCLYLPKESVVREEVIFL
jgi:hypothetical protein